MRCRRSGTYVPPIQKLKREDTGLRKFECVFKLSGYLKVDYIWKFNVVSGLNNLALQTELVGHPIVCRLKPKEREIVSDVSLIRVAPKNILAYLKWKNLKVFQISSRYIKHFIETNGDYFSLQNLWFAFFIFVYTGSSLILV